MRASIVDRYFLALMTFVFGWAFFWIPACWVKRGDFANGDTVISRATNPTGFWSWVIPLWSVGLLLMALGVWIAVAYYRKPADKIPRIIGVRFIIWLAAAWFVFAFFGLVVQFLRA